MATQNIDPILVLLREGRLTGQVPELSIFLAPPTAAQQAVVDKENAFLVSFFDRGLLRFKTAGPKWCENKDCRRHSHFLWLAPAGYKLFEAELWSAFDKANQKIQRHPEIQTLADFRKRMLPDVTDAKR